MDDDADDWCVGCGYDMPADTECHRRCPHCNALGVEGCIDDHIIECAASMRLGESVMMAGVQPNA